MNVLLRRGKAIINQDEDLVMLSKKQWQWLTDHHLQVRRICVVSLIVLSFGYVGLFYRALILKGKSAADDASTVERRKAGCWGRSPGYYPFYLGPGVQVKGDAPIHYDDLNVFELKSYWTLIFDVRVLNEDSKCFGAFLVDELTNSSPYVIYLYDKDKRRVVYKIEQVR
jgi:hypothetical protein